MSTLTREPAGEALLRGLLDQQQSLSAVEQFAQRYDDQRGPAAEKYYRDLIPLSQPEPGQQYAFEVDLDACSGCKACVAACHSLNGLDEHELWRSVGQLVGGDSALPVVQHITTACHHCVEPACLDGCPVEAYEKDPRTGIVRHLDDQCIGCQYCMLKCPYDVPVYSKSKGIVRKCDMCQQRLAVGEAPACVQSCPNRAIRIRLVDKQAILDESEANAFLPGAPEPGYTVPTTSYKSARPLPRNALPADYFSVQSAHGHLPLVFMLVFTQMSVGAFFVEQMMYSYYAMFREEIASSVRPLHLVSALLLGLLGLAASVFHLGRPQFAYRALLGLRRSWLSREILAFGVFATAAAVYVGCAGLNYLGIHVEQRWLSLLGIGASATGVMAVFCSIMIYVDTRRPCWRFPTTAAKFTLTSLVLGVPVSLLILLLGGERNLLDGELTGALLNQYRPLCQLVLLVSVAKLAVEASSLLHLRSRQFTPQKRSALLLTGELGMPTLRRFFFGVIGGVVLPLILLAERTISSSTYHPLFVVVLTILMLAVLAVGELHERYLFFAASVAAKMPGAPAR